jgi:hypothetical protein
MYNSQHTEVQAFVLVFLGKKIEFLTETLTTMKVKFWHFLTARR